MKLTKSMKLMKFLPDLYQTVSALKENGYKDVQKTITKDCYIVSAVSNLGSKLTEIWDAVKNAHILKSEITLGAQKTINELIREKLDGTPFDFYSKSVTINPYYEIVSLYSDVPKVIYRRIFDKVLNKVEYFKITDNGQCKRLFGKPAKSVQEPSTTSNGLRIRHNVTEKDGSVSTYLLNPKTQCLYKRNITTDGNTRFYKITPDGVLNLFNK